MTDCIRILDLTINLTHKEVFRGNVRIPLKKREYDFLQLLSSNQERIFTRAELLEKVCGITHSALRPARTVDVYMVSLRRKIDFKKPFFIQTVHGVGYALSPKRSDSMAASS